MSVLIENKTSKITAIAIIMLVRSLAAIKTDLSAREASVKISMNAKNALITVTKTLTA